MMDVSKPVLVTGASGYVAGWLIKGLLQKGLTVHATVRNILNPKSTAHLQKIADQTAGTIHFFSADLLQEGAFDQAMKGCEVVFHTASPFVVLNYKDAEADIVRPAVEGTRNVLNSVNRTASVKRVVLTSSIVSAYGDAAEIKQTANNSFDESHWNTTSSTSYQPYPYSKVAAEREAWTIANQQSRWDLVCVNPALVMGPSLTSSSQSGSIEVLQQFGNGTTRIGVPPMWNGIVDVRDVADAHIAAGFKPQANGRYIISGGSLSLYEMGQALREKFGSKYPFPPMVVPKWLLLRRFMATHLNLCISIWGIRFILIINAAKQILACVIGIFGRASVSTFNNSLMMA
jgi:nucleoside-diphosphate-sugar epimerase